MYPVQSNTQKYGLQALTLISLAYLAGSKRTVEFFPGALRKELVEAATIASLTNFALKDNPDLKKTMLLSTAASLLGVSAFRAISKPCNAWSYSTYARIGAFEGFILGATHLVMNSASLSVILKSVNDELKNGSPLKARAIADQICKDSFRSQFDQAHEAIDTYVFEQELNGAVEVSDF
jgi:hypothetical protein